jgi:integral membrane protein (TIGR01906 family)
MAKKVLWSITSAMFIVMLILTLLLTDVQLVAFNRGYYDGQYDKYQITRAIGISKEDLNTATDNLLNYMDGKRDNLDFAMPIQGSQQEFFSQRDKLHMIDVKNLFVQGKRIRNIGLIYCAIFIAVVCLKGRDPLKKFSRLAIYAFIAGIVPIVLLSILMNIDFYKYFNLFHEIFFTNDLWQLEPAKDRLINMFPEAFFSDTAFRIVFYYVGELLLLLIGGIITRSKRRALYK